MRDVNVTINQLINCEKKSIETNINIVYRMLID